MKLFIHSVALTMLFSILSYSSDIEDQHSKHSKKFPHNSSVNQNKIKYRNEINGHEIYNRQLRTNKKTENNIRKIIKVNGYLTSYLRQTWNNSMWENDLYYTPTYDGTNYIVDEIWQTWNGSDWVNSERETETHDNNRNWLDWKYYKWNGTMWEENDRETQSYNASGDWIEWIDYNWSGSDWVKTSRETISYDGNRNWIEWGASAVAQRPLW